MILQALAGYYEKLAEADLVEQRGWSRAKVAFGLEIGSDGTLLRSVSLKVPEERGKKTVFVPQSVKVPEPVTRSSGVSANFLCDNSGYLLGVDRKGKPERSLLCFQASRDKHLAVLGECGSAAGKAVKAFFEKWDPQLLDTCEVLQEDKEELLSGVNIIFIYQGRYVQDDEEVKAAWERYCEQSEKGAAGFCLVSGEYDEIARIHTPIKGVPGAQSSGAALVSFNAPAFESYGKEQSFNAPVGVKAMYAYTTALNYLIKDEKHRSLIGDMMVVYWAESGEAEYQDAFAAMMDPKPETQDILNGIFKNLEKQRGIDVEAAERQLSLAERFYILGLAPNAARLSVRFFYQDSFGNILANIRKHYEGLRIKRPSWDTMEFMGIWRMLQETVNKKSRDKKPLPNMAASTYRSILTGDAYPASLYTGVLGRIRAEQDDGDNRTQKITAGRAAIIKAYLIRNCKREVTVELNENNKNTAYVLGREFAVLEAIQEAANPGINATIKDRYFNSACTSPMTVFPILFRLKNSHIRKLDNKGLAVYYEKQLGDLQSKIAVSDSQTAAYPRRLSLEEQGMFILGYYHQNQKRYEKNNKEER